MAKLKSELAVGRVKDIMHDPARSTPVALVRFPSLKDVVLQIAPEGLSVGDEIRYGGEANTGNVLELKDIPVGVRIFGIETYPSSGPKICRCSGSFATIMNKSGNKVTVKFSSGKTKDLAARCRATIGTPAGGGRLEKPWVKAGKRFYAMHARGKLYPMPSGVNMSPVDHPYGGKSKSPKPSDTISRNAPPGQKVGSISARHMGYKAARKFKKIE
jgi:large subunit ribosomal protein L2